MGVVASVSSVPLMRAMSFMRSVLPSTRKSGVLDVNVLVGMSAILGGRVVIVSIPPTTVERNIDGKRGRPDLATYFEIDEESICTGGGEMHVERSFAGSVVMLSRMNVQECEIIRSDRHEVSVGPQVGLELRWDAVSSDLHGDGGGSPGLWHPTGVGRQSHPPQPDPQDGAADAEELPLVRSSPGAASCPGRPRARSLHRCDTDPARGAEALRTNGPARRELDVDARAR